MSIDLHVSNPCSSLLSWRFNRFRRVQTAPKYKICTINASCAAKSLNLKNGSPSWATIELFFQFQAPEQAPSGTRLTRLCQLCRQSLIPSRLGNCDRLRVCVKPTGNSCWYRCRNILHRDSGGGSLPGLGLVLCRPEATDRACSSTRCPVNGWKGRKGSRSRGILDHAKAPADSVRCASCPISSSRSGAINQ